MSDLERELRATLDDRAGRVESDLTGPELRRLADERAVTRRGRVRRAAPVLASAAAVAALGIGAALLAAPQGTPPPAVEPGGPRPATSAPVTPSLPATPTVSARPVAPRPSDSLAKILPSGRAVPIRSDSLPLQTLLTRPPLPTRGRASDAGRPSASQPTASRPSVSTPSAP